VSDHPHDQHRPHTGQDPAKAAEDVPTMFGQLYPTGDVLAVIDARADAERAVEALKGAGVPAEDVDLVDGAWFVAAMRGIERHRSPFKRFLALLAADESEATKQLEQEAAQGHTIVVVHADDGPAGANVVKTLTEHGAHRIQHYGRLAITAV